MPCLSTNLDFDEAIELSLANSVGFDSLRVVSLTRTRYTDAETYWQNWKIFRMIFFISPREAVKKIFHPTRGSG